MTTTNINMYAMTEAEAIEALNAEIDAEYEADEKWEELCEEFFKEQEEALYTMEEEPVDIDNNRKPVFFRGKFTTIDPFWESELEDEVWGTTFDKMIANFHKQVEYHIRTAKTYGHITPEKAARLAYETLEILEYYE